MFRFIGNLVKLRISQTLWTKPQVQRYSDDNFYAFTRDNILALFTNTNNDVYRTITYHQFIENSKLCNLFNSQDCVYVRSGKIEVKLSQGEMKAYILN